MIRLENLYKSYHNDIYVLKNVSLEVKKGEIYGLVGKNGAGKTTLMNIACGLLKPTSGTCHYEEREKAVGYLPDIPAFFTYFTAREYLAFLASGTNLSNTEAGQKISSLLTLVGLPLSDKKKIQSYSRGMLQRLGIAAVLINDPSVILLDEPTSALDPLGRAQLLDIIKGLRDQGKAILLSTHILSDMEKVCDRIGFLHNGKIVDSFTSTQLMHKMDAPDRYIILVKQDAQKLYMQLNGQSFVEKIERVSDYKITLHLKKEEKAMAQMLYLIADSGVVINSISRDQSNLESQFMEVISS